MVYETRKFSLLLIILCCALGITSADEDPDEGVSGRTRVSLLADPAIHEELGLNADQIEKAPRLKVEFDEEFIAEMPKLGLGPQNAPKLLAIKKIEDQVAQMRSDGEKVVPVERRLTVKYNAKIRGLLTEKQYHRLKQLAWWQDSYKALLDPEVAKILKLTEKQIEEISSLERRDADALAEMFLANVRPDGNPKEAGEKSVEMTEKCLDDALQLLSEKQKKQFLELKGPYRRPDRREKAE